MSKRNAPDPLLRAFFDTYKLNLLAIPREHAQVGDVYVETPKGVSTPGQLIHLLVPQFAMPKITSGETLTDFAAKRTRAIKLKAGLSLLEGFFSAIGASSAVGKIKPEYERKGVASIRFRLRNATRDSVDAMAFGKALIPCHLNQQHPFVQTGNRYYVSVGVIRSKSITVSAEDSNENSIKLELGVLQNQLGIGGDIAIRSESNGELTYEGSTPLAFGVELIEMTHKDADNKFVLSVLDEAVKVRREPPKTIDRFFIGHPEEGNVFLNLID
jgi:hypothetical protein